MTVHLGYIKRTYRILSIISFPANYHLPLSIYLRKSYHEAGSKMQIPVLLLKTRSQPHDNYEDFFAATPSQADSAVSFQPVFIPVLEHKRDQDALSSLGALLKSGELKERYGGMIFTSQRAVEGWADTVSRIEKELNEEQTGEGSAPDDRLKVGGMVRLASSFNPLWCL